MITSNDNFFAAFGLRWHAAFGSFGEALGVFGDPDDDWIAELEAVVGEVLLQ
jgi:hypothetical protein